MSLLSMHDKISSSIENNEYNHADIFDVAKVFDTVDRNILLKMLEFCVVRDLQHD